MALKWYTPKNVLTALVGRRGLEIIEQEAEGYEDVCGPGLIYLIPVRGIETEPPDVSQTFSGDAVALVRRTASGAWTLSGRLDPAAVSTGGRLCVPPSIFLDVLVPWGDWITTARGLGLHPATGLPTGHKGGKREPGKTDKLPLLGGYAYLCLEQNGSAPGLTGDWVIARLVDRHDDGATTWRTRNGDIRVPRAELLIDLAKDEPDYREAVAARFADKTKPEPATLRRLKAEAPDCAKRGQARDLQRL
jgi:hypothetical protein